MNGNLDHWPVSYPSLYNPMCNDDHHVESGDIGYDAMYSTHLPADMHGFLHPIISTDFLPGAHFGDTSYAHNHLYHPPSGNMSTNQRQQPNQQLYINTQLNPYQINDSESSTASSGSLSNVLATPSFQSYPGLQPSVHISSPRSAPAERGTLMLDSKMMMISPLPVSPMSPYSENFGGDNMFDPPIYSPPAEPDVVTQVPMPHILEWKRVMEHCGTNDFVSQAVYQPYTEADKKRYIRDVELRETIFFQSHGSSELGISLDDALRQRFRHLKDKDDRMFVGCGPSVSIRVQWPGYPPWSKQIPTMDFKNPKGHITRAKLAKNIATCIRRFTEYVQDKPMEAESDGRWKIGKQHIRVDDLILVSLHHVSKGSWQPQFRLHRPVPRFLTSATLQLVPPS